MRSIVGLALSAMLLTACSDDTAAPRTVQIPGAYTLLTVNMQPLPFRLFTLGDDVYVIELAANTMTLNANRTFRDEHLVRERFRDEHGVPAQRDSTVVFTGTWESQDSALILSANDATTMFGYVSGNRLTLSFESGDSLFTYVYRRN